MKFEHPESNIFVSDAVQSNLRHPFVDKWTDLSFGSAAV